MSKLEFKDGNVLEFKGGAVEVRTPKPDELLLSAQQWITRAREELTDLCGAECPEWAEARGRAASSALDHAMRALYELRGDV